MKIRIGSRGSRLAAIQVDEVKSLLKSKGVDVVVDHVTYATEGDKDKTTPLTSDKTTDDFFTDALDEALLEGKIDAAVHSAKDLPQATRAGLSITALTAALDETDAFAGKTTFKDLPSGAKIGTSSELRQKCVKALRQDVEAVDIRGTIGERLRLIEDGTCDGIIVAAAALKRLGLDSHIKDIMPWATTPLQGQLAVVVRAEDTKTGELFAAIDARRTYGRVRLVGAGPGDPDLITTKGIKALRGDDRGFSNYLTDKRLLEHAPRAEKIDAGKRKGKHTMPQAELSRLLREHATRGQNVVRLKGGDPLIFGRGAEEIKYLRAYHIPVDVIPGVSSATAIPSRLGVPLTARDVSSSVAFVSGHGKNETGADPQPVRIPQADTIVFLMGLTKLDIIVRSLKQAGWDSETPILVVSCGTREDEQVIAGTLATIAVLVRDQKPKQPALIVAGETVRFLKRGSDPF